MTSTHQDAIPYQPGNMRFRRFGSSGLRMSLFSLGGWLTYGGSVLDDQTVEIMRCAFENGINTFDTAECYANGECEIAMGKAIKTLKWKRNEIVLITKLFFGFGGKDPNAIGLSRKHIVEGAEASLKRAQLDYFDVILAHCPDVTVPMAEVVKAFNHLIKTGKCFYWGCSAWSAQQIQEAYGVAERLGLEPPLCDQHHYSALHREMVEREYAPLYQSHNLSIMAWSPLEGGILTGKYNEGIPKGSSQDTFGNMEIRFNSETGRNQIESVKRLTKIAESLNCSVTVLSLAWVAKNPTISSVILGASKKEQLLENLQAIDILDQLTNDIMNQIDSALHNKPEPLPTHGR